MPLDFPNSPTNGQIFSSGGMLWRYDGTKWVQASGVLALPDAPSDGNIYGRENATWASVNALLATPTNAALNNTGRNLIHNGLFNIAQRGAGSFTANGYTLDRWYASKGTSDTISILQATAADADRAAVGDEALQNIMQCQFTGSTAAGSFIAFIQNMENVRRLSGKQCTLSFWAKTTSGNNKIAVTGGQVFGSGGSPSANVSSTIGLTPTLSSTWTRYSFTFAWPSAAGQTFGTTVGTDYSQIGFWLSDQPNYSGTGIGVQSGVTQLWGVQLEIGSVVTPLAKRDPADELALCQRFYQTGSFNMSGYNGANNYVSCCIPFPVTMRAQPTIVGATIGSANISSAMFQPQGGGYLTIQYQATATGSTAWYGTFTASADL